MRDDEKKDHSAELAAVGNDTTVVPASTAPHVAPTPGPWDDASKYANVSTIRIFAGSHYIATVGAPDDQYELSEANARLIAAAPDLYEALKYVLEHCGDPVMENVARAALQKAEGVSR